MRPTATAYGNALLSALIGGATLAGLCVLLGLSYAEGLLTTTLGFSGSPFLVFEYNELLSMGGVLIARKLLLDCVASTAVAFVIHRGIRVLSTHAQKTLRSASLVLVVVPLVLVQTFHSDGFWRAIAFNYHGLPSPLNLYACLLVLTALQLSDHPVSAFGRVVPAALLAIPAFVGLYSFGISFGANSYLTTARPFGPATANVILLDSTIYAANLLSIHDDRVVLGVSAGWTTQPHVLFVEKSQVRRIEVTDAKGDR